MELKMLETVGQVAGIGGLSVGIFLLIAKYILSNNALIKLSKYNLYILLRLIAILAWPISAAGITAWVAVAFLSQGSAGAGGNITFKLGKANQVDTKLNSDGGNARCGNGGRAGNQDIDIKEMTDSTISTSSNGGFSSGECK